MPPVKVKDDIYWIGALDPQRTVFDVIMPLDHGTTYNAYLIRGNERMAVVETVKNVPEMQEQFLSNLRALVDPAQVDYVILNHLEPDHSGALENLLDLAPRCRVVVSRNGEHFVKNILNRDVQPMKVTDGDSLSLGGKTLRFVSAPFLHWPDTMFTYLVEDQMLFPCDFLGCHFCDERLFDDLVGDFSRYFRYYFNTIMRPFKEYALKALDKIQGWPIEVIAPSHGPILRTLPQRYIEQYREWSQQPPDGAKKALVFYASAYGNTRKMAQAVAQGLQEGGLLVETFDLGEALPNDLMDRVEAAAALVIGSPTFVGDALKPVWELLAGFTTIKVKGKVAAAFGSYGWSGEAVSMLEERLKGLKMKVVGPGVRAILTPTSEDLERCRELGRAVATAALT